MKTIIIYVILFYLLGYFINLLLLIKIRLQKYGIFQINGEYFEKFVYKACKSWFNVIPLFLNFLSKNEKFEKFINYEINFNIK